jgi:superfamily II DNA or RNA helicase
MLLVRRKRIPECAIAKLDVLRTLASSDRLERVPTLFYASAKDPNQAEESLEILREAGWAAHAVNAAEGLDSEQLSNLLTQFEAGEIEAIVAKKMLDEGIDVPAVRQAVLIASSKAEREWVQRRGRVLRTAPGKSSAKIFDIIALPTASAASQHECLRALVDNELIRSIEFAQHSINRSSVHANLLRLVSDYGLFHDA